MIHENNSSAKNTLIFFSYLGARVLISLAGSMLSVAIAWHLYQQSSDPFDLALIGLMQILPMLVLFIFSGWVVDYFPRKQILIICAVTETIIYLALAFSISSGEISRLTIFSLLFLHGCARTFYSPALQAILPNIVSPSYLSKAVAITSTIWTTAQTIGPLAAGLCIAWINFKTYWVLVGLCGLGTALFFLLPAISVDKNQSRTLQTLVGGIRYVCSSKIVLPSISLDLLIVLFGSVMVLLPIYAIDILQVGPETLGLLRAMPALGGVMMGVLLAKHPIIHRAGMQLFISLTIFSAAILVFALSKTLWVSLAALWVYGAADMVSVNLRSTLIQLATPDTLRGRVSAVNMLFIGTSNEMGDFRAGAAAAILGPVTTVLTGAAMAFGVVLGGYYLFPELRKLDQLTDADANIDETS